MQVSPIQSIESRPVWQALNEPIAYPSDNFVRGFFAAAGFIVLFLWAAPYLGTVQANELMASDAIYIEEVAGVNTEIEVSEVPPLWYYDLVFAAETAGDYYQDVQEAFVEAANQVLDVSGPLVSIAEFSKPGREAVAGAYLELMADPQ